MTKCLLLGNEAKKLYRYVIPFVIVHGVDVHAQLRSREAHSCHFVLQCVDPECTRDHMVQQQLRIK